MTTAIAINNSNIEKPRKPNGYLVGIRILRSNNKDVLRSIRYTFEWIKASFRSLEKPVPINNLIRLIRGGESSLAFGEFGQSLCRMGYTLTSGMRNGVVNSITNLTRSSLDFTWNFFKVCKTLYNYKIVGFASKFYINLMTVGGISFAASSADRIYNISKELIKLENNKSVEKKDALILFNLYRLAKNIGTFAVGIIVVSKALYGFVAPGMVMLLIGTAILISNIAGNLIRETYRLQIK